MYTCLQTPSAVVPSKSLLLVNSTAYRHYRRSVQIRNYRNVLAAPDPRLARTTNNHDLDSQNHEFTSFRLPLSRRTNFCGLSIYLPSIMGKG